MFKKLFIGLAPLFAITAFAVMPVAAQAVTQHWYQSGVKATEGEQIPIVIFGNEVNLNQAIKPPSPNNEINCRTAGGGMIENSASGPGVGGMNALAFYECKAPQCEESVFNEYGVQGRETVEAVNLPASINGHTDRSFVPWSMLLEESPVEGVSSVRLKIGTWNGIYEPPLGPPGRMRVTERCEIVSTEQPGPDRTYEGELKPEIGAAKGGNLNGTSAGAPSQFRFNGASTGALHNPFPSEATYAGNLKYLGYNHQELTTVKP